MRKGARMAIIGHIQDAGRQRWHVLVWIALAACFVFVGLKHGENILLVQAYGGWSPMDWVAHQLFPENFKADFPSGIAAYRMSSFMHLYLLVARLGVDLEPLIPWVIVFEVVFLGVCAAAMFRALVPESPYVAMAVFALLIVEGGARDMELARFVGGFYQGLYYNAADGLRLLGLALLFRGRKVLAAALLGISFTVHPVMAGMACLFALPYVLTIWRQAPVRHWLFALAGFLIISGSWLAFNFQSAEVASGGIPADSWRELVRMFTYHWYPVDIGVFTRFHERYILPLLCLVALAVYHLPRVIHGRAERLGIAWGLLLLAGLAGAGVLISEFATQPFLIKLALHRASDMLIVVSLLIVVAGLTSDVLEGRTLEAALAGALLLSPLANAPVPFPVAPTLGLLGLHAWRSRCAGDSQGFNRSLLLLLILAMALSLYYVFGVPDTPAYIGSTLFWQAAAAFFAFRLLGSVVGLPKAMLRTVLLAAMLGATLALSITTTDTKSAKSPEWKREAADYLAVQRWARSTTASGALFMVDPTLYYGWRDFSRRSSFGSLREWLHTSWLYDSRVSTYEEGVKRFGEFAIDIAPYKQVRPSIEGYHRLTDDLRQIFYGKDADWFVGLQEKYGIDYLVVLAKHMTQVYPFDKVFANSTFEVYQLPRRPSIDGSRGAAVPATLARR